MPPLPKRPKRKTGAWSTPRILDSTSPIVTRDIHAFLVTCLSGWNDRYSEDEKRAIIDALPPQYRKYEVDGFGALACPISTDFLLHDPCVKAAISRFKKEVSEGCYEKRWQNQARKAMQERRDGKFDTHLKEHTEETFGKQTEDDSLDLTRAKNDTSDDEWSRKDPSWIPKDRHAQRASHG